MRILNRVIGIVVAGMFLAVAAAVAGDKGEFRVEPQTNHGEKWRIGYYEGGEYIDYQKTFIETIHGLMKLGWIEMKEIPEQQGEQTAELWNWLSGNAESEYIEFVKDAHYTANWDDDQSKKISDEIVNRLNENKDIDLLIAMGTKAGQDLANDKHDTPTMVLSASDPLSSGIIESVEDSGFDHVHATVDPGRYERQIRVFHEIIGFKKLGVAYEDSVNGRSYAAIDLIEEMAQERGFEIVRCYTKTDIPDTGEAEQSVVDCFHELAQKVDAIYVTVQQGVTMKSIPELVKAANEYQIPTFSQSGSEEVKLGFLVSLSQAGFKYVGEFHAETFAKVFNGARPNDLNQLFEEPPKIAINLKTAEAIGFDPPIVILGAADEIFSHIARSN
ncbi:MAG: ABC transporter substrate-binding protein [Gammaproteobacteria bacterium]|nr:ABC transporter substrate-binding protein [Gammaproteobacteria bacterium]